MGDGSPSQSDAPADYDLLARVLMEIKHAVAPPEPRGKGSANRVIPEVTKPK
jgi:hypothetical protein